MNIYLVRHADPLSKKGLNEKESNLVGLSDMGKLQAGATGKALKRFNIEHIYSSNIQRAKETAEIINSFIKKDITFDDDLREFSADSLVLDTKSLKEEANKNPNKVMGGGESLNDAVSRFKNALIGISKSNYKNVCVVSHRIVIEGLLSRLFKVRPKDHEWLRPASVTVLRVETGGIKKVVSFDKRYLDFDLAFEILKRRLVEIFL